MPVRKKSELEQLISDIHGHYINYHTREIYLHSCHSPWSDDEEPGVEYRMATRFIKNLHILENQNRKNVLVHMHTPGGEWGDGMAIFDAIRLSKCSVSMLTYSTASSMSGVILQAADKRVLMPSCEFMIHHGSIGVSNNSIAAKSAIDVNEKYCKQMLQIFAKRAIMGKYFKGKKYGIDRIMSFIDKKIHQKSDWFLDAGEAVDYGFADGIIGEKGFDNIEKIRTGRKYKG